MIILILTLIIEISGFNPRASIQPARGRKFCPFRIGPYGENFGNLLYCDIYTVKDIGKFSYYVLGNFS